jgi:hypothetical protein
MMAVFKVFGDRGEEEHGERRAGQKAIENAVVVRMR